jgi:hypothetical protein
MPLTGPGLECITWTLTAFGLIGIVMPLMFGIARVVANLTPEPDEDPNE